MPAQPFVPGPVPLYVNVGSGVDFFGFAERGVFLHNIPLFDPYHTDFGGRTPTDYSYQGKEAVCEADVNWWDESLFEAMASQAGTTLGTDNPGDVGTLMGFEGAAFPLYLVFPYTRKAAYATQPSGYHFFQAFLDDESLPERGTRPAVLRLRWKCIRKVLFGQTSAFGNMPGLALYDLDVSACDLSKID